MQPYEKKANLDHVKPHMPLIKPTITNIVNNVNQMVCNNIRFSLTLQLKNKMVSQAFSPLSYTYEESEKGYYKELPFERYGFVMSDYEWYLHTSRLKDIYHKQKNFIRIMQLRQQSQSQFLDLIENKNQVDVSFSAGSQQSGMQPVIYYITPKTTPAEPTKETKTTNTQVTVKNDVHQSIAAESSEAQRYAARGINIDSVVARAVKVIEEKLHLDRIKKGW